MSQPYKATRGTVDIELTCEDELEQIEGNASAVDPTTDAQTNAWIRGQLASGNEWAWCCAHVRVSYIVPDTGNGMHEDDYLGCCSYESAADFKAGGYYDDMVDECIARINARLAAMGQAAPALARLYGREVA